MRVGEDDQYVPLGHRVFDMCVLAALGHIPVLVYLALRRYIWRDPDSGSREMRHMVHEGKLASCIGQSNLAEMLGLSRWSVNRAVQRLSKLGWVQIEELPGRVPRYILGDVQKDSQERSFAHFWADGSLLSLQVWLETEAHKEHKASFSSLLHEDRVRLTRRWFQERSPEFYLLDQEEPKASKDAEKQVSLPFGEVVSLTTPVMVEKKKRAPKMPKEPKPAAFGGSVFGNLEQVWREGLMKVAPGVTVAVWQGKERSQIKGLLEKYGEEVVHGALIYLCSRWDFLRSRFFRGRGGVPSIGFLVKFHDVIVPEAQQWVLADAVRREREQWFMDHPHEYSAPAELEERYQAIRSVLRSLGLEG